MNRLKNQSFLTTCLLLAGLGAALTACAAGDRTGGELRTITLPPEGGQIEARPGDVLELTLEGNPTTGYNWEIEALDETVLKVEGEPVAKPESDLVGAPSAMTFHFKALAAGQAELKLSYRRPWEEGVAPLRTYLAEITVK